MKKSIDRLITRIHCLLFGHKWCDDTLPDGNGIVKQSCECGAKRLYDVVKKVEK